MGGPGAGGRSRAVPGGPPGRHGGGAGVKVRLDGEELPAESGQSVAGVLLGAGRVSWRTTRGGGRPRGIFCGIGVCYDCLVVVNGIPDVRACQRLVEDGDEIRTQCGAELPS
ncbi:(2Fe-2S)-binding protein [Streptomyces sp. A5-4]|uniref:(2Fe-2S)-binding protein n=1 Tax=Streptomyces sp. A5-4 TaxID=3384771 RepID=UPI003DA8C5A9